jgi:hypothetical protein
MILIVSLRSVWAITHEKTIPGRDTERDESLFVE